MVVQALMMRRLFPSLFVAVPMLLAGCGFGATVTEASGGTDGVNCEERLDELVGQLKVDVSYDYEPSASPSDLAASVDAVVAATLGDLSQDGENVVAVFENLEVVSGDTSRGRDGDLAVSWYLTAEDRDLGDTDGISVLAFLWYETNMPTPAIEGLWFGCGPDGPARSVIVEPVEPGWPAGPDATLANLTAAVVDPDNADATETFTRGSLTCYHDLMESGIGDFAADATGFDTPEGAVDDWWTTGDGRFRDDDRNRLDEELDVPEVRYRDDRGNVQLVLGLIELPAGGWAVETMEACATP